MAASRAASPRISGASDMTDTRTFRDIDNGQPRARDRFVSFVCRVMQLPPTRQTCPPLPRLSAMKLSSSSSSIQLTSDRHLARYTTVYMMKKCTASKSPAYDTAMANQSLWSTALRCTQPAGRILSATCTSCRRFRRPFKDAGVCQRIPISKEKEEAWGVAGRVEFRGAGGGGK